MGNLSSKKCKVKSKTATQLFPRIIWTNIIDRLTVNDVYKSIRLVSKELKVVGEEALKNKDRLAIIFRGDTLIQCFDSSHFIGEKDLLIVENRLPGLTMNNAQKLGRMMPSLEILVFALPKVSDKFTIALIPSFNKAFPNLVCLVYLYGRIQYDPIELFPKLEHLIIQRKSEHVVIKFENFCRCPAVSRTLDHLVIRRGELEHLDKRYIRVKTTICLS